MESKIVERIKRENIPLEEHDGRKNFHAIVNYQKIIFPKDCDLNENEKAFSLAHELGHFYQYKNKKSLRKKFASSCREDIIPLYHFSFVINFYVLWEEFDAWIRSYHICKKEKFSTKGFFKHASSCFLTYVNQAFKRFSKVFLLSYFPLNTILFIIYHHFSWRELLEGFSMINLTIFGTFEFMMLGVFFMDYFIDKKFEENLNKKTNL